MSCPRRVRAVDGDGDRRAARCRGWCPRRPCRAGRPGGGSVRPTLTRKVRVTGSACGATSRTRPWRLALGSLGQGDGDLASGQCRASQVGRDLEDGVAPIAPCELHDHPAGCDDLAGLRADCRDHAGRIGLQGGEADDVLCRSGRGPGPRRPVPAPRCAPARRPRNRPRVVMPRSSRWRCR